MLSSALALRSLQIYAEGYRDGMRCGISIAKKVLDPHGKHGHLIEGARWDEAERQGEALILSQEGGR